MSERQERKTLLSIKNKLIVSKVTNQSGRITRTYLDNIYIKFRYNAEVKINLFSYEKYLIVSDETKKILNNKKRKYLKRLNNELLFTS